MECSGTVEVVAVVTTIIITRRSRSSGTTALKATSHPFSGHSVLHSSFSTYISQNGCIFLNIPYWPLGVFMNTYTGS